MSRNQKWIVLIEIFVAAALLLTMIPLIVCLTAGGFIFFRHPFFCQPRVGKNEKIFRMWKFRSLPKGTPQLPTHHLGEVLTNPYGYWLRRTKLDEIPQLFNVVLCQMSFVGPRPCLPQQQQLRNLRRQRKLFSVRPGITGLAQILNIDMADPDILVRYEEKFRDNATPVDYLIIITATVIPFFKKSIRTSNILHQ